jgi:hypothetical protein
LTVSARRFDPLHTAPLRRNRIGVGVLKALRSGSDIEFTEEASPIESVAPKSDHLVVCEEGDDPSQVIAANYAFSLRAGLHLIREVSESHSEQILECFYSLYDQAQSPMEALQKLSSQMRALCGEFDIPPAGSITFISGRLLYGFAFPKVPARHLFKYNKRAALLAIAAFMRKNGRTFRPADDEAVAIMVLLATGKVNETKLAKWIRAQTT